MVQGISVRAAVYLCACFFASAVGRGQEVMAGSRITGQVVDQQGGVLPETTVILLNTAGVRLQQTKTGQNGAFTFSDLPAGEYVVGAERAGFAHAEQRVTLTTGQAEARVSIEMKISGPASR